MKNLSMHLKLLTLAIVGASLFACDPLSTRHGSNDPAYGAGVGACASCVGWGAPGSLFTGTAYGSASFPMAMSVEIVGDSNLMAQRNSIGADPSKTYAGQVYLRQAAINVGTNLTAGQCVVPAGTYTLAPTKNIGNYAGGSFVIPQFELSNGTFSILAGLQQGAIVAPPLGGPARGFGALLIISAGPSRYAPQQRVNCLDNLGFQLAP